MGDNMKKRAKRTMKEKLELVKEIGIYLSDKEGKKKLVREKFGIHPTYYYQLRMNFLPLIQKAGYESWEEFLSDPGSVDKVMERGNNSNEEEKNETEKRDENKETQKETAKETAEIEKEEEKKELIQELKNDMNRVVEKIPQEDEKVLEPVNVSRVPFWKKRWFWIMIICGSIGTLFLVLNFRKKDGKNNEAKDIDNPGKGKDSNFEIPPEF